MAEKYEPKHDDVLTLGDAIRALPEFTGAEGDPLLVSGQHVMDLLMHRGLLQDPTPVGRRAEPLDEIQGWLEENRDTVIDDDQSPFDELAQILARARVVAMVPGTTVTALQTHTRVPTRFMVVRTSEGTTWLSASDGVDRDLDDIDLTTIRDITPPPVVTA